MPAEAAHVAKAETNLTTKKQTAPARQPVDTVVAKALAARSAVKQTGITAAASPATPRFPPKITYGHAKPAKLVGQAPSPSYGRTPAPRTGPFTTYTASQSPQAPIRRISAAKTDTAKPAADFPAQAGCGILTDAGPIRSPKVLGLASPVSG